MRIKVAVKDKAVDVHCGEGTQTIRWLADAALARYDSSHGVDLGAPIGVTANTGQALDLKAKVRDVLVDGAHVFVQFHSAETGAT